MQKLKLASVLSAITLLPACGSVSNGDVAQTNASPVIPIESQVPATNYGAWGIDLSTQDQGVKPGDDFYKYANGGWLREYQLPADKTRFGMLGRLNEEAQENVKKIIVDLSETAHPVGTVEQQVGDLYASYMNMERRNALALTPIQPVLAQINAVTNHADVYAMFANSDLLHAGSALVVFSSVDRKDPSKKILGAWADGTGLPDRDYYLVDSERFVAIRAAYKVHIQAMLAFAGYDAERAEQAATDMLAMETELAKVLPTRAEARDASKNYNPYSYAELLAFVPDMDWPAFIQASGIDLNYAKQAKWVLRAPATYRAIVDIVNATPVEVWKDFMTFSLIAGAASSLHEELELAAFEFRKTLSGQQQRTERWKRGVGMVSGMFSEAVGEVYVKRHFSESSKAEMKALIDNLGTALNSRLQALPWMTEDTKQQALLKLASFNTDKIGYPDKWQEYQGLTISSDDLYGNLVSARTFFRNKMIKELQDPVDRTRWNMSPQTVNAYYSPVFNEIVFPAAILQAPLFDMSADPAVNYGAIGAIIGHEMSHGFDDQGRRYDASGRLRNWWTEQDSQAFNESTAMLVEQYSGYEAAPGVFVNGQFTLGENIGDLGGVMIAYEAYHDALNGQQAPVLDGLTGDQRFFLSWAQVWREKTREEMRVQLLKSDPHAPGEFRVNGIMRNVDAWYEAFNVQASDALYLPPEQRVRIW